MVQDLSYNLCESLVENIDGVSGATCRKVVVATPVITLTDNSVTITCDTTGATIYYTLDGSTPTSSSSQYSSAFTLDSSCTIKAIAINGGKSSAVAEENYVKPITYLTNWKIVGNSEVHGNEIWSCGEYNATDGKYHILVQPLGGSIADIVLDEPLRKVNDVADSIEFANGTATVTRNLACESNLDGLKWFVESNSSGIEAYIIRAQTQELSITPKIVGNGPATILCAIYTVDSAHNVVNKGEYGIALTSSYISVRDSNYAQADSAPAFKQHLQGVEFIYWIEPITETIEVPQIAEAENYTCVISQGVKAVEWSSFETD